LIITVSLRGIVGETGIVRKACIAYYGRHCQRACRVKTVTRVATAPTLTIDEYMLDTLMPDLVGHDRQPSAFLVYLLLWRQTHGVGNATTQVALRDIAEATGLSKRAVQDALGWLVKRKLISLARESMTAVPIYTVFRPWRR
jgi:hypothetical protein